MSLIAYISFAWMYSVCDRKEDNHFPNKLMMRERFFGEKKKDQNRFEDNNNHNNSNAPGSPGLPLAGADVRNPREENWTLLVFLLVAVRANRRTIAVTAADMSIE